MPWHPDYLREMPHSHDPIACVLDLAWVWSCRPVADVHEILSCAVNVFPGGQVPKDWEQRNTLVEGFSDETFALWHRLDCALWSISSRNWSLVQKYLQNHEAEILDRESR